jgi:hypothetical protein
MQKPLCVAVKSGRHAFLFVMIGKSLVKCMVDGFRGCVLLKVYFLYADVAKHRQRPDQILPG